MSFVFFFFYSWKATNRKCLIHLSRHDLSYQEEMFREGSLPGDLVRLSDSVKKKTVNYFMNISSSLSIRHFPWFSWEILLNFPCIWQASILTSLTFPLVWLKYIFTGPSLTLRGNSTFYLQFFLLSVLYVLWRNFVTCCRFIISILSNSFTSLPRCSSAKENTLCCMQVHSHHLVLADLCSFLHVGLSLPSSSRIFTSRTPTFFFFFVVVLLIYCLSFLDHFFLFDVEWSLKGSNIYCYRVLSIWMIYEM